jgi:glycosyltransferase involved in cell wall biosynthesis
MERGQQPLVSILMTAYNREQYIAEAIESVLASTYTNWELIIVDDGSADNTVAIAKSFLQKDNRIHVYVNEKNLGDYYNRNRAASYATGKYIKYLDADDTLYDFGLEIIVRLTEQFPEAGFGLGTAPDDNKPCPVLVQPREIYLEHFFKYSHFDRAPGSGLIKKQVFEKIGGFSGKRMVGDYEFWFKIARYYSMVKLPIDLYWNRLHPGQESQTEYAKKNYDRLRREVLDEALAHPDCPLAAADIHLVQKHIRQERLKNNFIAVASRIRKIGWLPK